MNTRLQKRGEDEGKQYKDEVHEGGEGEDLDEFGLYEEDQLSLSNFFGQAGIAMVVGTFQGKSLGTTTQGPLEGGIEESHYQRESRLWIVSLVRPGQVTLVRGCDKIVRAMRFVRVESQQCFIVREAAFGSM